MPHLNCNSWLRPVLPAGAAVFLALLLLAVAATAGAQQQDNLVRVRPTALEVSPGGTFRVAVVDTPPEQSLAAWVIELAFDPDVVTTESTDCSTLDTPSGAVGAFACEADDTDDDGRNDTLKILGAVIFSGTRTGLIERSTLADIRFSTIGDPGDCTDLRLRLKIHADNNGDETGALVQDGQVCIRSGAPAGGTEVPNTIAPRTNEPTPEGGETLPPLGSDETPAPGESGQSGVPSGQSGSTDASGGPEGTGDDPDDPDATDRPGAVDEEDGGISPIVWVVVGVLALGAAGAAAWALVRRGAKPVA